ncbi:MAG: hypothetical protein ACI9Y1_002021 [Lentisphaeria bacterium]|jgi:hypothetical protein
MSADMSDESQQLSECLALAQGAQKSKIASGELLIGTCAGFSENGQALVRCEELYGAELKEAAATVLIEHRFVGRQVALMFVGGDTEKPIIVGFIRSHLIEMLAAFKEPMQGSQEADEEVFESGKSEQISAIKHTEIDSKLLLESENEIVLKCGESSITLTKSGKIMIRGTYILNRSSGLNRILGGSVDIN